MARLDVELIPAFSDNYLFLLTVPGSTDVGIVDPGDAAPVIAALERRDLALSHILCTHHHPDHVGGVEALKARFPGALVIGPKSETARIPHLEKTVAEGDVVTFGGLEFQVFEVPGHTSGHIAYWCAAAHALFCGDTMFALGCGRLFEGTPEQMWRSLSRLRALPPETRVYCAHEYTLGNARFARTVDPENPALAERAAEVERLRAEGRPTVPSTIGAERATNPFLRADDPGVARAVGLAGAAPVAVFAEVRGRKDRF